MTKSIQKQLLIAFFTVAFLGSLTMSVISSSSGYTGKTETNSGGCNCHSGSSSSNTSLSVVADGGDFVMKTGETETFTLTVANSSQSKAGVNIAVKDKSSGGSNAGSVSANTGLKKSGSELTHTSARSMSGGEADFEFTWKAPNTAGTYYILAIGNAVDGNGGTSGGDEWNWMSPQAITVKGLDLTSLNGGQAICAGETTTISWTSGGVNNIKIELSTNGGSSWDQTIVNSVAASQESYSWDVPSDLSGSTFRIRISDASDASLNESSSSNFSIGGAPAITKHPQPVNSCTGEDITLTVSATGPGLQYQWKKDQQDISNSNSSSLQLTDLTADDAGSYTCLVLGECGAPVESEAADVTVNEAPAITDQSGNSVKCLASSITLSVTTTGDNLTYAWKKDGILMSGETNNNITITSIKPNDQGTYTCDVISQNCGTVTSDPMTLTVNNEPELATLPNSVETCVGTELLIEAEATGEELAYQWFKDDKAIPDANLSSYKVLQAQIDDTGIYKVRVTNSCGQDESNTVDVVIITPPNITAQPQDVTVAEGGTINLEVKATSSLEITYQWRKDDAPINGETNSTLTIENATQDDSGDYSCYVTNDCGTEETSIADVMVQASGSGPILSLSQTSYDFGNTNIGETSEQTLTGLISNTGDDDLEITSFSLAMTSGDDGEITVADLSSTTLAQGENVDVMLTFAPQSAGTKSAEITIESNAGNFTFSISGNGVEDTTPEVTLSASNIDFGSVQMGQNPTSSFDIQNTGSADVTIISASNSNSAFKTDLSDLPTTIASQNTLTVNVSFSSDTEGEHLDTLVINIDGIDPIEVPLRAVVEPTSIIGTLASSIEMFPNPASENISISFVGINSGNVDVKIIDINGTMVRDLGSHQIIEGNNLIEWDGKDSFGKYVTSGYYSVMITSGDDSQILKLIIE